MQTTKLRNALSRLPLMCFHVYSVYAVFCSCIVREHLGRLLVLNAVWNGRICQRF
jgi:hypothetical protein